MHKADFFLIMNRVSSYRPCYIISMIGYMFSYKKPGSRASSKSFLILDHIFVPTVFNLMYHIQAGTLT